MNLKEKEKYDSILHNQLKIEDLKQQRNEILLKYQQFHIDKSNQKDCEIGLSRFNA